MAAILRSNWDSRHFRIGAFSEGCRRCELRRRTAAVVAKIAAGGDLELCADDVNDDQLVDAGDIAIAERV